MLPRTLKEEAYKDRSIEWQGEKGRFYLFDRIDPIADLWSNIPKQRIYLQLPYLRLMEKAGLQDTHQLYGVWVDEKGRLCAVIYCQLKDFKADESINWSEQENRGKLKQLRTSLKKQLASKLRFKTLVVGNLSMSGPFGQWIETSRSDQRADIIMQMAKWAYGLLQPDYEDLRAILLKDYFQPLHPEHTNEFTAFEIQPAMELSLRKSWHSFSNYLADLRSKYRVRYRKAVERFDNLKKVKTRGDEIDHQMLSKAYRLYLKRAGQSDFNIATLEENYFHQLCHHMGERVYFQLYFEEEQLVAFMCMIHDEETLDAQFTGYEDDINKDRDLYLNLLYDTIDTAISKEIDRVCFARTAMEIKSSVGANPRDLYCYLYYDSNMAKLFVPSVIKYLEPKVDWNQRHPFKSSPPS